VDHLGAELERDPIAETIVGSRAAADPVAGLEHDKTLVGSREPLGRGETGEPGTDYDDVDLLHQLGR
jgi:hypothetical protein